MANKKFTFANGEGYRVSVYAEDRYEAQEMAERKFKENGRSDCPVRMVPNSRACNALTPADEKKMCDIMKRYLNKPGDKVMLKTHEGLPNGMSRTTVEVFAAYQDDQRETPDYRIKAAKKAVMGAMRVPCVGDGTRPMNDGSFSGHLVFMNGESICSTDKVVANAVEYVGKHVENARVRIKHVGFLNKWLVRDPNMGSRQRAFDSDREAIKWAEENGHEWTVENSIR